MSPLYTYYLGNPDPSSPATIPSLSVILETYKPEVTRTSSFSQKFKKIIKLKNKKTEKNYFLSWQKTLLAA